MSKRLTIELSDDEYATLERHAKEERRSVEQMAEYIVVKAQPQVTPVYVYPQVYPLIPQRNPNWFYYTNTTDSLGQHLQSTVTNGNVSAPANTLPSSFVNGLANAIGDVGNGRVVSLDTFKQALEA